MKVRRGRFPNSLTAWVPLSHELEPVLIFPYGAENRPEFISLMDIRVRFWLTCMGNKYGAA